MYLKVLKVVNYHILYKVSLNFIEHVAMARQPTWLSESLLGFIIKLMCVYFLQYHNNCIFPEALTPVKKLYNNN